MDRVYGRTSPVKKKNGGMGRHDVEYRKKGEEHSFSSLANGKEQRKILDLRAAISMPLL